MRSLALVAASLAGHALAVPMLKERALVTDLDIVTITQYVTATGPCPTTGVTNTVSVTEQAASSSSVSSYVVVTSYTSSAAPETTAAAPETTSAAPVLPSIAVPSVVSSVIESIIPSSSSVAPTSTYVAPTTSAAPVTTVTPSTTATPSSSSAAAGGFSTYAFCPTSSLDASASLTTAPADAAAKKWLAYHNAHRANHTDGCSLYWDEDLAAKAKVSAQNCVYEHDNGNENWGQNMGQMAYSATGSTKISSEENADSAAFFTHMYYQEYEIFGPYWGAESVPVDGANAPNILHFTQMVWKDTYSVGCAVSECTSNTQLLTFCNYRSRGNIAGEYGDQVTTFISSPHPPICAEIDSDATDGSCITDAELGL